MAIFEQKQEAMLELLKTIVNMDSGSYDKEGVDFLGEFWMARYKALGFEVEVYKNNTQGNNYRIYFPNNHTKEWLFLLHLDTVFPKGTAKARPFHISGDRAFGPGIIDMKGSHVMLYFVIEALIESDNELYKNIEILINSDEEIGSPGSRSLIEQRSIDKKIAFVMEPGRVNGAIVSARRGVGGYVLKIYGKSSHSGVAPKDGISAIEELGHKIIALHALSDHDHGLSINVGLVSGGNSVNTVAPYAEAKIDVRISTQEQGVHIDKIIQELCAKPILEGVRLELEGGINRPPMIKTEASAKIIEIIKEEGQKLGLKIEDVFTGGGSDASFTSGKGIPTIDGLGPVGGCLHSEDEYLEIASLKERATLLFNVLKQLKKGNE